MDSAVQKRKQGMDIQAQQRNVYNYKKEKMAPNSSERGPRSRIN